MSSEQLDPNQEEKLDHFLKGSNPQAPEARAFEKQKVLGAILRAESEQGWLTRLKSNLKWFAPVAMTAVLVIVVGSKVLTDPVVSQPTVAVSDAEIEAYLEETLFAMYEDDGDSSDLNGSNDWLTFADKL